MNNQLLMPLPKGPLAIIGDIHGELAALDSLLGHLAAEPGPARHLVFIGDLCDRGPDSVGVIRRVQQLVQGGRATCILGNHEINLLANDAKDGSGWFFDSRIDSDSAFYSPFARATATERAQIREFLATLPLALHDDTLRVVHATWEPTAIRKIRNIPQSELLAFMSECRQAVHREAAKSGLLDRYEAERQQWARQIEDPANPPPYLHAVAEFESLEQRLNPIKALTSGTEEPSVQPFYSGNRWRYSDRTAWWENYHDPVPVVIGHYWRMFGLPTQEQPSRYSLLFKGQGPTAWLGQGGGVFCVDYSVGARWRERKAQGDAGTRRFRLAALQWPERSLVFDDGERTVTLDGAQRPVDKY